MLSLHASASPRALRRTIFAGIILGIFVLPLPPFAQNKTIEIRKILVPKSGDPKKKISIETENFIVTFSEAGGSIYEFKNKDAKYPLKNGENVVLPGNELFFSPYLGTEKEDPLSAILKAEFKFEKKETADLIEVIARGSVLISDEKQSYNLDIAKTFTFLKKSPYWKYSLELASKNNVTLKNLFIYSLPTIGPKPGNAGNFREYHAYSHDGKFELAYNDGGGSMSCAGSTASQKSIQGANEFISASARFLIINMQPLFPTQTTFVTPEIADKATKQILQVQAIHLQLGDQRLEASKPVKYDFLGYMGPKLRDNLVPSDEAKRLMPELNKLNKNLYKSFDFGITEPIRDIIVWLLNLLFKIVPNYGVGIILIALLLKVAFFPLNQKQAESMKRLGELQPKIKELNDRYKNNREEKQRKLMELYKTHKVNPISGCLPMLIQLPVFISLYSAFSDSYDLWRSPFIPGWISDLSQPDLIYMLPVSLPLIGGFALRLLPVIMTITQFYQTKLTPSTGDESQRKIMLFMPFMMLFLFYPMPSGVVLYWTVQNVLSIVQQLYTNKKNKAAGI